MAVLGSSDVILMVEDLHSGGGCVNNVAEKQVDEEVNKLVMTS